MSLSHLLTHPLRSTSVLLAAVTLMTGCGKKADEPARKDSTAQAGDTAQHAGHHHSSKAEEAAAHTHSTKLEFSSVPAAIEAGKPSVWTLKIVDAASGQPIPTFDLVHEKLLHLIVVSRDFTWFNHVHPEHKGNGVFTVTATLPRQGEYVLYADYTPAGKGQEIARQEIATAGATGGATAASLTPDAIGKEGWVVRTVGSAPEGMPEKASGQYQVAMMPMPGSIKAGEDAMLHFEVRDAAGKPLTALEPYLGAMGHCVILSADSKIYLHTHPSDGDHAHHGGGDHGGKEQTATSGTATVGTPSDTKTPKGAEVMFHTNFPLAGLYKVWGQFQYKGQIITAPFVVEVK